MKEFNEEQLKAIKWNKGPCLVLGTPGSGKTTVIINRIYNLVCFENVDPAKILVITFTRAAADSMEERFKQLCAADTTNNKKLKGAAEKVRFGTFHSFFFWIIRATYKYELSAILNEDEKRVIVKELIKNMKLEYENEDDIVQSVIRQFGLVSCDMIDIDNYYSQDMPENSFRELYRNYQKEKEKRRKIDFDDMLSMSYRLFVERTDIRDRVRELFPYVIVDEFQDTNLIQYELLKQICHPNDNLFVVGDDDQSIYGFRGSRPDIMLGFEKEFKGTKVINLKINYRCPRIITSCSSKLIGFNKKRFEKSLESCGKVGHINIQYTKDIEEECQIIVDRIRKSINEGASYKDIAILCRTNMNPRRIIFKLREYNIPFQLRDTVPNVFEHFAVQTILNYIRFARGENSREIFLKIMNKPVRYIRRNMLDKPKVDMDDLLLKAKNESYLYDNIYMFKAELKRIALLKTPAAAINYIRKSIGFDDYIKKYCSERNLDKDEIFEVLDEFYFCVKDMESFEDMFSYIEEYGELLQSEKKLRNQNYNSNCVKIMTLHSSKGLEFLDVHIIECVEGIIPHKKSKAVEEMEEERRMFYVGMTRAIDNLYIYVPDSIADKKRTASRFIAELRPAKK